MKQRNSSIELLRIICIIAILFHHYFVHGGYNFSGEITNIEIVITILGSFGKIAACIFILISGYFLINSEWKTKRILYICIKTLLIFVGIIIFYWIIEREILTFEDICMLFLNQWFIRNYIFLCFCYPIINFILKKCNKKWFVILIIIMLIFWSIIPTIQGKGGDKLDIGTFLVMYTIGAYIKLYTKNNGDKKKTYKILALIGTLLFTVIITTLLIIAKVYHIQNLRRIAGNVGLANNILAVFCSVMLFKYFININFSNKKINYIAESMLGVYLIHDNYIVRRLIWRRILPNVEYLNSSLIIVHMLLKIIIVFIICVTIDKLISLILKPFIEKNFSEIKKEEENI